MFDGPGEDVRDGFNPAMRMPGKAREIILGNVIAEIVEQEKGIKVGCVSETEGAAEMNARAFESRF